MLHFWGVLCIIYNSIMKWNQWPFPDHKMGQLVEGDTTVSVNGLSGADHLLCCLELGMLFTPAKPT